MNNDYQKMSEILDNWLSDSLKETKIALIEKEILLEKVRKLYVLVSALETEEYAAPKQESDPESSRQYTPAKTMEEDVELFFDTEHESYNAVEQDLKNIAEEISETQAVSEKEKLLTEKKKENTADLDIFDQIEEKEKPVEAEDAPLTDNAEELFAEPDFEITVQPEKQDSVEIELKKEEKELEPVEEDKEEESHEEDDILQFIPPKSVPEQTGKSIPVTQKSQRSLNDLFNERREDHSISSQYQRAKVGDLTKAISINDKFIYIKELFHNRGEDFSASISQLNECRNMEEAFDCLENLKQKFFWDSKSDAYLSFCDLLRRKYS